MAKQRNIHLNWMVCTLVLLLTGVHSALCQSDDPLQVTGFYQFYAGVRTDKEADFIVGRNRAEINLQYPSDRSRLYLSGQINHHFDAAATSGRAEHLRFRLREAFLDAYWDQVDVRIGLQQIVWGEADGAFITDLLSPLDLTEFLTQDFRDIRLAIPATSVTYYADEWALNGVFSLRPLPSLLPEADSPWNVIPEEVAGFQVVQAPDALPDFTLRHSEWAVRATYEGLPRTSVHLLYLYTWNRIPAFRKEASLLDTSRIGVLLTPTYYRRHVVGADFSSAVADDWVLRGEAAFHSRMFLDQQINLLTASGSDRLDGLEQGFLLEKPFAQIMLGVERGFTNQTLRLQMLTDYVFDYDDRIVQDAWTPATTALWLGRFRRETLTLQVFAYYRLGKDYWWNPALTYAVADGLNATLGYHGFGGPDEDDLVSTFSFKLYDEDDFVYVNVKYNF